MSAGFDLISCYKIVFGMVRVTREQFRVSSTRGHPFKLYKRYNSCVIRWLFFTERVNNIVCAIDYKTPSSFKQSLHRIDLTGLLANA